VKSIRLSRIYFGWWINIVASVSSGLVMTYLGQGGSALLKPISADLGLTRSGASLASGAGSLVTGVIFALAGRISDRFGPKGIIIIGHAIVCVGMALMYFVHVAWAYYVVWGVISAGMALGTAIAVDNLLTKWFIRKRGLAFSVRFGIMSIVGAGTFPGLSWLITTQGWRAASVAWAGLTLISIPFLLYFVKPRQPEYHGWFPDGAKPEKGTETDAKAMIARTNEYASALFEIDFTLKEAKGKQAFWMLTIAWVLYAIVTAGFNVHVIPFLTDRGITPVSAAAMLSIMLLVSVPARMLSGIIADRIAKTLLKYLMAGAPFLMCLGMTIFLVHPTMVGVYIMLILIGVGAGSYVPLDILIRARYFGRKAFGAIQGISILIATPFTVLAPVLTGWVYDVTGKYTTAFAVFAALAALSALALVVLQVPVPAPAEQAAMRGGATGQ
jgi:MFS family permease